jgi:hypothetical protein
MDRSTAGSLPPPGNTITGYGAAHPDEWAGLVVDPATGRVTARFRGHLPIHQAAIERLVLPGADFELVFARASNAELRALADRVVADKSWLDSIGAPLAGYGVDVANNVALIDVYSEDEDIGATIIDHFDADGLMTVRLKEQPWDGRWANLDVTVVGADGQLDRSASLRCETSSQTPRVYPRSELVDHLGQCGFIIEATTHLVEITQDVDGQRAVVGSRTTTVKKGEDIAVRIKIDVED